MTNEKEGRADLMLEDEVPPEARAVNLEVALRGRIALLERLDSIGSDPRTAFRSHVRASIPYFRTPRKRTEQILNKELLRAQWSNFVSRSARTSGLFVHTNGTLAPSLRVAFDRASFFEFNYLSFARIFRSRQSFIDLAIPNLETIFLVSDNPRQKRFTTCLVSVHGTLMRRLPVFRDDRDDYETLRYLRTRRMPLLYGKTRALLRLARLGQLSEIARPVVRCSGLIVSGEPLYSSDREKLVQAFQCEPVNIYSSSEGGLMAVGCSVSSALHIASDRVDMSVRQTDGTIAASGTGEVVVTNFMNWGHAFVQYAQSDEATVETGVCRCGSPGPTIVQLQGRDSRHLHVKGVGTVPTVQLEEALSDSEIAEYRVTSDNDGSLRVEWMPEPMVDTCRLERRIRSRLRRCIGREFRLMLSAQVTAPGSKLRRFV